MTRNRLYFILFLALLAGYSYVLWEINMKVLYHPFTPCIFKNITGMACPSCGVTRSILLFTSGNLTSAVLMNPLGLIVAAAMLIIPFWLLYDVAFKKDTLYFAYKKTEHALRIKWVAISLIILMLMNWAWNIHKGL